MADRLLSEQRYVSAAVELTTADGTTVRTEISEILEVGFSDNFWEASPIAGRPDPISVTITGIERRGL